MTASVGSTVPRASVRHAGCEDAIKPPEAAARSFCFWSTWTRSFRVHTYGTLQSYFLSVTSLLSYRCLTYLSGWRNLSTFGLTNRGWYKINRGLCWGRCQLKLCRYRSWWLCIVGRLSLNGIWSRIWTQHSNCLWWISIVCTCMANSRYPLTFGYAIGSNTIEILRKIIMWIEYRFNNLQPITLAAYKSPSLPQYIREKLLGSVDPVTWLLHCTIAIETSPPVALAASMIFWKTFRGDGVAQIAVM